MKGAKMTNSILLIQSKLSDNKRMGTGFVVHQDSLGSYVLTCAHVIDDVQEADIEGFTVELKAKGSREGIDLAVLYVKGLFRTPEVLQEKMCPSKEVELIGYSKFSSKISQVKPRAAQILDDVMLTNLEDNHHVKAWQIIADDHSEIEPGNSGSPLFCKQTAKVIGVVSNNHGVKQGYAVSIEHLKDIWHKMPPFLLEANDASPFVGLSAFSIEESHLFFGRDKEITLIIERLKKQNLVSVVGDSGSGKSSVIKAGVIPKYLNGVLASEDERKAFHLIEMRPATNPFNELANSLRHIDEIFEFSLEDISHLKKVIKSKNAEDILNALESIFRKDEMTLLLYIDQFEELFTLCESTVQKEFIALLVYLLEHQSTQLEIKIVFTMRRDYYNLIADYEDFFQKTQESKCTLRRMKNEQIQECIEKPLEKTLMDPEQVSAFSKAVINDMGDESSELTLLQIALTQTWQRKGEYDDDLLRTYHEIGEVSGALANLADNTWQILSSVEQRILKYIFIRIIQPSETGGVTRRLADKEEFSEDAWLLVQKFSSALDDDGKIARERNSKLGRLLKIRGKDGKVVELIHEALVTQWPMYQRWLKEVNKNHLKRMHDRVIEKTKKYQLEQNKKFLLMGYELEESLKLLDDEYIDYLSEDEIAYIKKSEKLESINRLLKRVAIVGLILLVLVVGYLYFDAKKQRDIADKETENAKKHQKIANQERIKSKNLLYDNITQQGVVYQKYLNQKLNAKLFFAEVLADINNSVEEKKLKIRSNSIDDLQLFKILENSEKIEGLKLSKNGQEVIYWTLNELIIWDVTGMKEKKSIAVQGYASIEVKFHDDKKSLFLSASKETEPKEAKLMVLENFQSKEYVLSSHNTIKGGEVYENAQTILTWDDNHTVSLWSLEDDRFIEKQLIQSTGKIKDVKLSADRSNIVIRDDTGQASLWRDENETFVLKSRLSHDANISEMKFNRAGTQILTRSFLDGVVKLWDSSSGNQLHNDFNYGTNAQGMEFSPDDNKILIWTGNKKTFRDAIVTIVDVATGEMLNQLKHDTWIYGARFSHDGEKIFSWSYDNTFRVWAGDNFETPSQAFNFTDNIRYMQFSEENNIVLGREISSHKIRLWKQKSIDKLVTRHRTKKINGIEFREDGTKILSRSNDDKSLKLWKIEGVATLEKVYRADDYLRGSRFIDNEKKVFLWDKYGEVKEWDIEAEVKETIIEAGNEIKSLVFNDSNIFIVHKQDGNITLVDRKTNQKSRFVAHQDEVNGIALAKKSARFLSWGQDKTVKLWEIKNNEAVEISSFRDEGISVTGAIFNEDENQLLSWNTDSWNKDKFVTLWDIASVKVMAKFPDKAVISGAIFSKVKEEMISWSQSSKKNNIYVWSLKDQKKLFTLKHDSRIRGVIFNDDESLILSFTEGGKIRLWDRRSGKELFSYRHNSPVIGVKFEKSEEQIMSWDYSGEIQFHNLYKEIELNTEDYRLEAEVKSKNKLVNGEIQALSDEEWKQKSAKYDELMEKRLKVVP